MGVHEILGESDHRAPLSRFAASLRRLLLCRVWLPPRLYAAIPVLYLAAGAGALWSALYLPGWTWVLPYVLLFAMVCLHVGFTIASARSRSRQDGIVR
jgi:hypothetical protein